MLGNSVTQLHFPLGKEAFNKSYRPKSHHMTELCLSFMSGRHWPNTIHYNQSQNFVKHCQICTALLRKAFFSNALALSPIPWLLFCALVFSPQSQDSYLHMSLHLTFQSKPVSPRGIVAGGVNVSLHPSPSPRGLCHAHVRAHRDWHHIESPAAGNIEQLHINAQLFCFYR